MRTLNDFEQTAAEYEAILRRYVAMFGRAPRNAGYWQTPDTVLNDMKTALITGIEVVSPRPPNGATL